MNKTKRPSNKINSHLFCLVFSMLVFGTIGVFRKYIPMPSAMLCLVRGVVGSLFIILFVKLRGKKLFHGESKKTYFLLLLSGIFIGLNWVFLFEAYNLTTVSIATLGNYLQPTLTVVFACLFLREKFTAKKGICTFLALFGMVMVSGVLEEGIPEGSQTKGIVFCVLSGVLYAFAVLLNQFFTGVDAYEKTVVQLLGAVAVQLPYTLLTQDFSVLEEMTPKAWIYAVILGVVYTGINYTLWFYGIGGCSPVTGAMISYLDPVTSLILSALILDEKLSIFGIVGAVLVLGSALFQEIGGEILKKKKNILTKNKNSV